MAKTKTSKKGRTTTGNGTSKTRPGSTRATKKRK